MQNGSKTAPVGVLLFEENLADADFVSRLLREAVTSKFETRLARKLEEAIAHGHEVDCILVGVAMLNEANLPWIQALDNRVPGATIIVLAGCAGEPEMVEAVRLGAQDVLLKVELEGLGLRRRIRFAIARKETERLLRAVKTGAETANHGRGLFLAKVSHELRTPLGAIMGFAEIIRDRYLGPDVAEAYCARAGDIHDSASYLLGLINDLLDVSRVDAGKMELKETRVSPREVIGSACMLLQGRAASRNVRLALDVKKALPSLRGDRDRLQQIVVNLVSNAVKFTPAGGAVTVGCDLLPDGRLAITVSDTGVGIPEDKLSVIWRPFGQVDNGHQNGREGTGLGLPMAAQLVRLHGGRIDVSSVPGAGSTFTVIFPADRLEPCCDDAGAVARN